MKFLTWLFARTPAQSAPVPESENFRPFNLGALARSDAREREDARRHAVARANAPVRTSDTQIRFPDVFCMIEYRDVEGSETRRRVTLRAIDYANAPLLRAYCHERRAARTFRLDRVLAFISPDGEVIEPKAYCSNVLGIEISGPAFHQPVEADKTRTLLAAIATHMTILVAVARADGKMDESEIDRIESALERELASRESAASQRVDMDFILNGTLCRMIKDCRPTRESLARATRQIARWPAARLDRLGRAVIEVVRADGQIHEAEIDILDEMARLSASGAGDRLASIRDDMAAALHWNAQ